jgi:hypothetical protein
MTTLRISASLPPRFFFFFFLFFALRCDRVCWDGYCP